MRELFEELLEHNILVLPEIKGTDEVAWTGNLKFYPYHWIISHSVKDYFRLKGKIQDLIDRGTISLPNDSINLSVH